MMMGEIYINPHETVNQKSICIINKTYDPYRVVPHDHSDTQDSLLLEQGKSYDFDFCSERFDGHVTDIVRYHNLKLEDIIPSKQKATYSDLHLYAYYYRDTEKWAHSDIITRLVFSYPRMEDKQTIFIDLPNSQLPEGVSPIKPTEGDVKHD